MGVFTRSSREEDDEEALKWAALEKLPTFDRLRKGILTTSKGEASEINTQTLVQPNCTVDPQIPIIHPLHRNTLTTTTIILPIVQYNPSKLHCAITMLFKRRGYVCLCVKQKKKKKTIKRKEKIIEETKIHRFHDSLFVNFP